MANSTGKAARRARGNRAACKRGRGGKSHRAFGKLPVSAARGNAQGFALSRVSTCDCANGCPGVAGGRHVARPRTRRVLDLDHDLYQGVS